MYDKEKPDEDSNWITQDQAIYDSNPESQFFNAIQMAGLLPPSTGFIDDGELQTFDGIEPRQHDCEYWYDRTTGGFKTPDGCTWHWKTGGPARCEPAPKPSPLAIRCMADIEAKSIDWFWPGKIARGKVTMIAGNPGLGKSQLTLWLAAVTSTGGNWPNKGNRAPMGSVLIISGEDAADDTIKPRLMAVDADLGKIHIIDGVPSGKDYIRGFDLSSDIDLLEKQLAQLQDITLVVIDPISAYLGGTDSHKNADVRALLAPLSSLAEKHNAAIVLVSHLNKSGGDAVSRITGSGAFVAASRATFIVASEIVDGKDTGRRLFVPAKNNLGPDDTGLAFTVKGHRLENGIETSRIALQSGTVCKTADEVLAAIHTVQADDNPKRSEAEKFLRDVLSDGPLPAKEIKRQANEAGIHWRTIERAKKKLRVTTERNGFGKDAHYEWHLPNIKPTDTMDRQALNTGGLCNGNTANLPTDAALPIDRQMVDDDGVADHEKTQSEQSRERI